MIQLALLKARNLVLIFDLECHLSTLWPENKTKEPFKPKIIYEKLLSFYKIKSVVLAWKWWKWTSKSPKTISRIPKFVWKKPRFWWSFFFGPILKASTGPIIPKLKPKYFKTTLKFVKIIHKNTTTTKVMSIYISIYIPKDWKFPNYSKKRKWKVPKKIVKVVSVERFFVCPSKIAESQDLT